MLKLVLAPLASIAVATLALVAHAVGPGPAPGPAPQPDAEMHPDGLFVGHEIGRDHGPITFELRGRSLVILDDLSVSLVDVPRWEMVAASGKGGDLQLGATATVIVASTRGGQVKKLPMQSKSALRMRFWPARRAAVLCATDPRTPGATIDNVPPTGSDAAPPKGVQCYDLALVWEPEDGAQKTPVPVPAPPEPDFECMRECRQQNMMRAVGPEVIDADCRTACAGKKP